MFGQAMATFVPPMLPGVVIFTRSYAPDDILRQIRERRVSVLVSVPKILEVLQDHILRVAPEAAEPPPPGMHWARRWWRYRRIHRMFGWKFWAMVVGAAPLDPELEAFWGRLGFLIVQGYGLTETAPIVTLNHPLRARRGTVGTPIAGVEIKIAPDGEILVRGENVTRGLLQRARGDARAFEDGWFHTGDIGELDAEGRLHDQGPQEGNDRHAGGPRTSFRKTSSARSSRSLASSTPPSSACRYRAERRARAGVLVLAPDRPDVDAIVRGANASLDDHQRVVSPLSGRGRAPADRRHEEAEAAGAANWLGARERPARRSAEPKAGGYRESQGSSAASPPAGGSKPTTLDELGLSSLDRVELMMALEEAFQTTLDESSLTGPRTIHELESLLKADAPVGAVAHDATNLTASAAAPATRASLAEKPIVFPAWNRTWPSWFLRRISLPTWILPLGRIFMKMQVAWARAPARPQRARSSSRRTTRATWTRRPSCSLPSRWRYRVAPAMAKEFFKAHFIPQAYSRREWFTNSLNYYLVGQFFNAFPLPQAGCGTRQTLRYIGDIVGGWLLGPDLPRRAPRTRGRSADSARSRDDWVTARRSGGPRPNRRARQGPPRPCQARPVSVRSGAVRLRARLCPADWLTTSASARGRAVRGWPSEPLEAQVREPNVALYAWS